MSLVKGAIPFRVPPNSFGTEGIGWTSTHIGTKVKILKIYSNYFKILQISHSKTKSGSLSSNLNFLSLIWLLRALAQKSKGTNVGAGSTWPWGALYLVISRIHSANIRYVTCPLCVAICTGFALRVARVVALMAGQNLCTKMLESRATAFVAQESIHVWLRYSGKRTSRPWRLDSERLAFTWTSPVGNYLYKEKAMYRDVLLRGLDCLDMAVQMVGFAGSAIMITLQLIGIVSH